MADSTAHKPADPVAKVDKEALARKYAEERAKRIRPDGVRQYRPIEIGSELEIDPFAEVVPRDPISTETTVAILGAGWAGEVTAVRLRQQGVDDFTIIDKAGDFGGAWYWNRYPGIACDCESYIYMPLLEETGYMPSMRYAPGDEILDYAREVGKRWALYENAIFHTIVTDVRWNEETLRWIITTNRGDEIQARFVITGTGGVLHRPKLPDIPGIDTFEGYWFHSSRWDFDCTGGNSRGNLDKLNDKRVAIIGTGPTALQCFPHVADDAAETYVFQRTPVIVDWRGNHPTDEEWYRNLEPGWQKRRMENFEKQLLGLPVDAEQEVVEDAWLAIWGVPPMDPPADDSAPDIAAYMTKIEENDIGQMERIRARVDELVDDPEVAESLKPWYATHCKRPSFHDSYLQKFNKPNVHLVDTQGRGPDEVTPRGIVFDGKEYEVDLIIYATGFESLVSPARSGGFDITGAGGVTLDEAWKDRVRTVHGVQAAGFPNMFHIDLVRQAGIGINQLFASTEQSRHVAIVIRQLLGDDVAKIDVTEAAVQEWCDVMDEKSPLIFNAEAIHACTPSYLNNEGDFDLEGKFEHGRPVWADVYGGGLFEYVQLLEKWRETKEYEHKATIVGAERGAAI